MENRETYQIKPNDTQPLTPDQLETIEAQNAMTAAINEQYKQIKRNLTQKISQLPVEDQVPSIEESRKEWWDKEAARVEQKFTEEDQAILNAKQNWQTLLEVFKPTPQLHKHGPFTFLLNQNHNALRGCQSCGAAWVGVMAGTEDSIRWHEVQEAPENEE